MSEKKKEQRVFCINCSGLKVPLYSERTDDLIFYFFIYFYLNEKLKGTAVTPSHSSGF